MVPKGDRIMGLVFSMTSRCCKPWGLAAVWFVAATSLSAIGQSDVPANRDSVSPPSTQLKQGYRQQETDDPAFPLQPVKSISAAEQSRNEAVAWFMAGRLLETRGAPKQAVNAYRKALAIDPKAIEVYRNLVPLEFQMDEIESAIRSAMKAVELDPQEYEMWQMLAAQAALSGKLPEAIRDLEQALKSPRIVRESPESLLLNKSLGILYSATGQPEKAADCYEVVFDALLHSEKYKLDFRAKTRLLADPQTSYERIGQIFLDAKRIKLAEQAFELAAKSGRVGAGNLNFNRSRILLLSDKPDEALVELKKYLDAQRTSKGREAYQLLADILEKLNRGNELISQLEALSARDEHNLPLQFFLAEQLVAANELEKAKSIYESTIATGADATGYVGLAQVLRKMQKPGELLDVLSRAMTKLGEEGLAQLDAELKNVSNDEKIVDLMMAAGRAQAKADPPQLTFEKCYLLASIAKTQERTDDAVEFYQAAIKLNKDRSVPLLTELGNVLLLAHRYAAAVDLFTEALKERHPPKDQADLLAMLARAQLLNGTLNESIESINEALRIEPNDPGHLLDEAWIYARSRQWEKAIARFEKLQSMLPDNKRFQRHLQFNISNIYVQKGEFQKGEEILEKILEVDPDDTQVNNDLGYLWADQGKNLDRAEKMIRKAVAAEPDNGAYLDSLGWVLFKLGKPEEAIGPIEQSLKKNSGGDSTLWDHLGDVQLKLKQVDRAVESWQKALNSTEEDKFADPQLLERLRDKLKQYAPQPNQPKPAQPGTP
jgi:tetratricopeptide (TPR) repeat protein